MRSRPIVQEACYWGFWNVVRIIPVSLDIEQLHALVWSRCLHVLRNGVRSLSDPYVPTTNIQAVANSCKKRKKWMMAQTLLKLDNIVSPFWHTHKSALLLSYFILRFALRQSMPAACVLVLYSSVRGHVECDSLFGKSSQASLFWFCSSWCWKKNNSRFYWWQPALSSLVPCGRFVQLLTVALLRVKNVRFRSNLHVICNFFSFSVACKRQGMGFNSNSKSNCCRNSMHKDSENTVFCFRQFFWLLRALDSKYLTFTSFLHLTNELTDM